jgi:hypothetical protein
VFIYIIVNDVNDKIYIGKTIGSSLSRYLKQKIYDVRKGWNGVSYLYNAMKFHGVEHFSIHPLISSLTTNEDLCFWERVLIAQYDSQNPDVGYNICRGGEGFTGPHTEQWKKDQSQLLKAMGHKPTLEATIKSIDVRRETHKQSGIWPGAPFKDMTGTTVNGVEILVRLENTKEGDAVWSCRCRCGEIFTTEGSDLRSGHVRSCGCLKTEQDKMNLKNKQGPLSETRRMAISGTLKKFWTLERREQQALRCKAQRAKQKMVKQNFQTLSQGA